MISVSAKRWGAIGIGLVMGLGAAFSSWDFNSFSGPKKETNQVVNPSVPIVSYQRFSANDEPGTRDLAAFRNDLQRLKDAGYRPVLLSEYVHRRIDLPDRARPVVITFDGSDPSQFRLLPKGEIDPECAVGVWYGFAQDHPSFPIRATFFLDPGRLFGARQIAAAKLKLLTDWGCEFGLWPEGGAALSSSTDKRLEEGRRALSEWGIEARAVGLPFGQIPRDVTELKHFEAAVLPGAAPAPPVDQPRQLLALPRVPGDDSEFGLTKWLTRLDSTRKVP